MFVCSIHTEKEKKKNTHQPETNVCQLLRSSCFAKKNNLRSSFHFFRISKRKLAQIEIHRWKVFELNCYNWKMINENKYFKRSHLTIFRREKWALDVAQARKTRKKRDVLCFYFNGYMSVCVCMSLFRSFRRPFRCYFRLIPYGDSVTKQFIALETDWSAACTISFVTVFVCWLVIDIFRIDTKWHTATIAACKLLYMQITEHWCFNLSFSKKINANSFFSSIFLLLVYRSN